MDNHNLAFPVKINRHHDFLFVVDVQNDFMPQYCDHVPSLPVEDGNEVVKPINHLMELFDNIIITQDWHAPNHYSFASQHNGHTPYEMLKVNYGEQILWPDHCVAGSWGAEFHPDLITTRARAIIRKGTQREIDSYSAFFENDRTTSTGLDGYMNAIVPENTKPNLFFVGLAFDFCVAYSAIDAAKLGYNVIILMDYCRAINRDNSKKKIIRDMRDIGIKMF